MSVDSFLFGSISFKSHRHREQTCGQDELVCAVTIMNVN